MNSKYLLLLLHITMILEIAVTAGCSRKLEVDPATGDPLTVPELRQIELSNIRGKRIQDLTVVIFQDGLSRSRWERLLRNADSLSALQSENDALSYEVAQLNESSAQNDGDSEVDENFDRIMELESKVDENVTAIGEIVYDFYNFDTAYLLRWTIADSCTFSDETFPRVTCTVTTNLLNGGLPAMSRGANLGSAVRRGGRAMPHLELAFRSQNQSLGDFEITLQLAPELVKTHIGDRLVYKGEAVVSDGSWFQRDGVSIPHFKYGYAELRVR